MSDRTPADVIASDRAARRMRSQPDPLDYAAARNTLAALAAAGFRVVPIPDDNTRTEVAIPVLTAPEIREDSWLHDDRHERVAEFRGRLQYARTQTRFIEASHGLSAEAIYYIWFVLNREGAAAYLGGQPEDRPAQCPTCGSDDPDYCNADGERHLLGIVVSDNCCPHPWHGGGSGDTR